MTNTITIIVNIIIIIFGAVWSDAKMIITITNINTIIVKIIITIVGAVLRNNHHHH